MKSKKFDIVNGDINEGEDMNLHKPIGNLLATALSETNIADVFALDSEVFGANAWKHEWFEEGLTDGIARELLLRFLEESRARGLKSAVLETGENNLAAQNLYASLGFAVEEIRPKYYNDGRAALIMRKHL